VDEGVLLMGWAQVSKAMALDPMVTPSEMRVYVAIATYRGSGDRASPGMGRLARETGLSVATIKRSVAGLIAKKYLAMVRSGGGRAPNVYRLLGSIGLTGEPGAPMTPVTHDPGHPCTPRGVTHDPAGGSPMTYEEEPVTRTNKNNHTDAPQAAMDLGDNTSSKKKGKRKLAGQFPPSPEAALEYGNEWIASKAGYLADDVDRAVDYLDGVGWTTGKRQTALKDWQGGLRTCIRQQKGFREKNTTTDNRPAKGYGSAPVDSGFYSRD
jgi:hypothetical protein